MSTQGLCSSHPAVHSLSWQLYAFLIDVMQQLVAGFTMCTETGYLTPLAQRDVPEIVLPFRWWDSGQNVRNDSN